MATIRLAGDALVERKDIGAVLSQQRTGKWFFGGQGERGLGEIGADREVLGHAVAVKRLGHSDRESIGSGHGRQVFGTRGFDKSEAKRS